MPISSQLQTDASELTIKVDGRFDFSTHQAFRKAYEQHAPAPAKYRIDLAGTSYLDSSALGMLLLLRDYAGGDQADVRIVNCSDDIRKVLTISNFQRLFVIE